MNTMMKVIIGCLIIALMWGGFYAVKWSDMIKEIDSLKGEYAQKVEQKKKLEDDVAKLSDYRNEAAGLEKELMSLVQSKFTKEEPELFVANYIAEIERLVANQQEVMGDESFAIKSISPQASKMTEVKGTSSGEEGGDEAQADEGGGAKSETLSGFPTRVFNMDMTGRYSTLVDFLYQLGSLQLDRLVTINQISLRPNKSDDGGSPVLSISIPITAYLRQGSN